MMTLWILSCRITEQWDTLFTFYARDHEQAEQKVAHLLSAKWVSLRMFPSPLRMYSSTE